MEIKDWLSMIGGSLAQQFPHFLVIIAGLAFCIFSLKKYPKASRTALAGLIILLLVHIFSVFLPLIFTHLVMAYRGDATSLRLVNLLIGFFHSLVGAAGLGLVIYAVWIGRNSE